MPSPAYAARKTWRASAIWRQRDAILVYAAGGWMDTFDALAKHDKDMIFFCRHKSGPVYLWYEIISPRLSAPAWRRARGGGCR